MSEFNVQKGIEITPRKTKYPWADLKPGDSFFVPLKEGDNRIHIRSRLNTSYRLWCMARHMFTHERPITIRFTKEKGVPGLRIWRINKEEIQK